MADPQMPAQPAHPHKLRIQRDQVQPAQLPRPAHPVQPAQPMQQAQPARLAQPGPAAPSPQAEPGDLEVITPMFKSSLLC